MPELVLVILLILSFVAGLLLIPFGLPGLWLMVLAVSGFAALTGFERVGWPTVIAVAVLALIGEVVETWLGFKMAKRYGGSSRAGWGALGGGIIGAVMGTPVPIIGNVIGAFLGAFVGAAALEHSGHGDVGRSLGAGWGAVLGRAAAAATKIALGLVIAILGIGAALR